MTSVGRGEGGRASSGGIEGGRSTWASEVGGLCEARGEIGSPSEGERESIEATRDGIPAVEGVTFAPATTLLGVGARMRRSRYSRVKHPMQKYSISSKTLTAEGLTCAQVCGAV
eukprot:3080109-Rhodomonas_salina.1